jgi:hypothetical protein
MLKSMQGNDPIIVQEFRNDLKSLRLRYTNVEELVNDRILKLDKAIFELKSFHDEFDKTFNSLKRIETFIKNEQTALGDSKLLHKQIEQCKTIIKELDSLQLVANKLNDYVKHLYVTTQPSSDSKYLTKIKSDMHELNEKLMSLMHYIAQQERDLQVR